jgi:hypothetical protein
MVTNKTTETIKSVKGFINALKDETQKKDSFEIMGIMNKLTGFEAKLWGASIIGFGSYHYVYESGREGDMPIVAFSPRSTAIVLYIYLNIENREELLNKLGKHKAGKGCIYIKKLADIDIVVLKTMIRNAAKVKKVV